MTDITVSELQVGSVYKDKRGIDVLVVAQRLPVEGDPVLSQPTWVSAAPISPIYSFKGIALGNIIEIISYASCGKFSLHHDNGWEHDLLLETGKLWTPVAD